jgi:hypothetical protein
MRRREFIGLIAGATVWPLEVQAQLRRAEADRLRRGVVGGGGPGQLEQRHRGGAHCQQRQGGGPANPQKLVGQELMTRRAR